MWMCTLLTWGTTWDQHHLLSCHLLSLFSLSRKQSNVCEWDAAETIGVLINVPVFYLNIDEIVEWVNMLLHKPFHLKGNLKKNQFILVSTKSKNMYCRITISFTSPIFVRQLEYCKTFYPGLQKSSTEDKLVLVVVRRMCQNTLTL